MIRSSFLAENTPELYEAHFGVPMLGAILNAINCRLDSNTIAYILQHSESKVLVCDREFSKVAKAAIETLVSPPLIIDIDDPAAPDGALIGNTDYEKFILLNSVQK